MKSFSQRIGIKPVKSTIQLTYMDKDLRNSLWNALTIFYWEKRSHNSLEYENDLNILFRRIWNNFFKIPIDTLDNNFPRTLDKIRSSFFSWKCSEVYDFIEFVANNFPIDESNLNFMKYCNMILEQELSAYRFVGGKITQITSENEIMEIEESLKKVPNPVSIHLENALGLLSDRKSPDYRNSIKESISAVESICKLITQEPKGTLGSCLNVLEKNIDLHHDLKKAFQKLYGYTCDSNGIRHALRDKPDLEFEDAKFMLVSCSAFTNYLMAKVAKTDLELGEFDN